MKANSLHIVAAIVVSCFSFTAFAQAPNLGSAARFVLFSSTGAVGNTGATSHFTGNIGTVTGAITMGVNVNGVIHNDNPTTTLAAADVLSAYSQLDTTTPTTVHPASLGSADTLGGGDTLTAGVDSVTKNTLLYSTLVLDAQSNPNAVFIFKINGTLSSTTGAEVILINGAQACNVFWQVKGLVNMVSGTTMRGTIIAKSSAINLGAGSTLEGRALTSTAGAITTTSALAFIPSGCGTPVLTGPTAPNLGSTACYALFTSTGSNTGSDSATVTGDIGSNAGLTTGYDSSKVNGDIHPQSDSSTAQCASDLLLVFGYLDTLAHDIELQFPAQFGNNLVLTPHTYLLNAATALTDTLYLNAENNPNGVFVIKINGALSTSVGATVILTKGAQAKNVYWHVDGAADISDSAIFKGTIVSGGAVDLRTAVNLEGRALTKVGAFTARSVTATIPPTVCASINPLPLVWLYFRGKPSRQSILLDWGTTADMSTGYFTLGKSRDAKSFETLSIVNAATETGNAEHRYSFTDYKPYAGLSYYRISHTDATEHTAHFRTIEAGIATAPGIVTHSISGGQIHVQYSGPVLGSGTIHLYSTDGRRVASQPVMLAGEGSAFLIEKPRHPGMYLLYLESRGEKLYGAKVIID
jgi:hypothetical protein